MKTLNEQAILELMTLMAQRGVEYQRAKLTSLVALPNTEALLAWMKANPEAGADKMWEKAKSVGESIWQR